MFNKLFLILCCSVALGNTTDNQTDELSPISFPESLPFTIDIQLANFQLAPEGLQTFAFGVYKGEWLLISGRINGLHGFNPGTDNFPPRLQNTNVYVVSPEKGTTLSRSLYDASAKLTQGQIDTLSTTANQFYQVGNTLYLVGGYGVDTGTGQFSTKSTLTAIDLPGLISWVKKGKKSASRYIRQTSHPLLQVTGGVLMQTDSHSPFLLSFGQNFPGYYTDSSNGYYTQAVRPFQIIDNGDSLYVHALPQPAPNPNYRRRDLNVMPLVENGTNFSSIALSGVFTLDTGIWTVPIFIDANGGSSMLDPANAETFKQGMNNYNSAATTLYSKKSNENYILLYGGISYQFFEDGSFQTDAEIPFINNVTTVSVDSQGNMTQYLMANQYPTVLADFGSPPDQPLYFGAGARFIPASSAPLFPNGAVALDKLASEAVIGYIVGGIQCIVPDTTTPETQSAASPYVFTVTVRLK